MGPRLSLDALIPDKKTAPVSMLDEMKERMRRRNRCVCACVCVSLNYYDLKL